MVRGISKRLVLVFGLFVFAFLYRVLLMTHGGFSPGADIGLHNSVVHSIISQGSNVDFLYNFYQMGGGLSLTFPGYHLFVAQIILLTGMPDYLVHTVVGCLFSSVMVLVSYLLTRVVWRESVAVVVVFLVAVSRFDIEMLFWGGFPNVVALLLIPVTFYLYLQKSRFTKMPFYISSSLLVGSIFIVHSLSSVVFVSILFFVIVFGLVFGKKVGTSWREMLSWLVPVVFGCLVVLPYLVQSVPAYFTNTLSVEIIEATASTLVLPLGVVLPFFVVAWFYFVWSKKFHNRYFTVSSVLLVLWMVVPTVFTQGYLVGLYTDFHRFLYFAIFPLMILIGLFVDFGAGLIARVIEVYRTLNSQLDNAVRDVSQITRKRLTKLGKRFSRSNLYGGFLIILLLGCFSFTSLFLAPREGLMYQTFYQVMNDPLYQAMEWVKVNTPADAVFVSEAYFGWWLSGFAQRATWSAEEPQFLLLSREVPIAKVANNLLDTDYLFESSFKLLDEIHNIQVREDGGYMARHNPQVLTCLNDSYAPYAFFNFDSYQTKILYEINNTSMSITLDKMPVLDMHMENDTQHTTVSITRGNEYFTCTQLTTVNSGSKHVNTTTILKTISEKVSLSELQYTLEVNALPIGTERGNSLGFLAKRAKAFGQIIFNNKNLPIINVTPYNSAYTEVYLNYDLEGNRQAEIQMSLTTYSTTNDQTFLYENDVKTLNAFFDKQMDFNLKPENRDNLPLPTPFNYQTELKVNNIDYIAVTRAYEAFSNADIKLKFANDPMFNLVFINPEVAIFEVKK
jgi:hypothetical protein